MTVWYVVLLAAIITAVGTFVVIRLRADLVSVTDRALRSTVPQIAAGYSVEGLLEFRDKSNSLLAGGRNAAQILSAAGTVVSSSGDRLSRLPMLDRQSLQHALRGRLAIGSASFGGGAQFRVAAAPVVRRGERQVIVAAVSLAPVDHSVHRVLVLLLLALPAALVATAAGGWWLAKRAMRPIDRMVGTVLRTSARDSPCPPARMSWPTSPPP